MYKVVDRTAEWSAKYQSIPIGKPDLICVHRTGNAGLKVTAESNNNWAIRTGAASWHAIVEGEPPTVYELVPSNELAWHILETRKAHEMGRDVTHPAVHKPRGDIRVYGIETDEDPGPDGKGMWTQSTKDTLIQYLYALIIESQREDHGRFAKELTVDDIKGHSEFDPWTRSRDPDELMRPEEIRNAVRDKLGMLATDDKPPVVLNDNGLNASVRNLQAELAVLKRAFETHLHKLSPPG